MDHEHYRITQDDIDEQAKVSDMHETESSLLAMLIYERISDYLDDSTRDYPGEWKAYCHFVMPGNCIGRVLVCSGGVVKVIGKMPWDLVPMIRDRHEEITIRYRGKNVLLYRRRGLPLGRDRQDSRHPKKR